MPATPEPEEVKIVRFTLDTLELGGIHYLEIDKGLDWWFDHDSQTMRVYIKR